MIRRPGVVAILLVAGVAARLVGQGSVAARLTGRVPPDVVRAVAAIATSAAARGLPVEPLIQKAIEGGAKGVPAERVIDALHALATQLDAAASALRTGRIEHPGADVVEGGAYALAAGLSAADVRDLAQASHGRYDPALTLRVAATLAALGVPAKTTRDLVRDMINSGRAPGDILNLPSAVQAGMARGATPAQAAQGLAHGAAGGAQQPPGRPPDWVPPGQQRPRNPHKP